MTVMELLIVLAVVGLLAAISFYSLHSLRPRLALRGAASELSTMMNKARLDAIRFNQPVIGTIETDPYDVMVGDYNPTSIGNEYFVLNRQEPNGALIEIHSYRFFRGFPAIHLWGEGDAAIHGSEANTYDNDKVVFLGNGNVFDTGALRISYDKKGTRNTLEVGTPTTAGIPEVRKFLLLADRPTGATFQEYFVESSGGPGRILWVWY